MKRIFFKRFGVRVTAAIILSMLTVVCLSAIMLFEFTYRNQFRDLRSRLKDIAKTAAININSGYLQEVPLNREGVKTQAYAVIREYLKKVRAAHPQVKSVYILTKVNNGNVWQFVVDDDQQSRKNSAFPGDHYDAGRFPEMLNGYNAPSADRKVETDEWGTTLSGYAPIRDYSGKPIAVLGVDIDAQDIYAIKRGITVQTWTILLLGVVLAVVLGALISQRVIGPVQQLIAGARYIGEGNLHYQVKVKGDDEIAQLAEAFNDMSRNLILSRQQLVNYFFDTVRSLVKILEVRDHYTLGHSESVAAYAGRIALRMGIDPKTREMFHNVCLLHDIGKVGVRDSILLKPDGLTPEEWQTIQLHTVWGEQILKPILQDTLMLSVIRNHHERYDGKGYPDGLKESQIPLLVAITTVADSYDAMTSTRAYRKAMNKEDAVAQLVKNRGTQFHPAVVDAFLAILAKDS